MKIAHISDIHIRNYKYHYEYKEVFNQLFDKLRELKPDIIINTGDTAHTKANLSPEYFKMTSWLFKSLADIAPFHTILGNHDVNVKNLNRLDAVSPVVTALEHPNVFFHKFSTKVELDENIVLNVISIMDEEECDHLLDKQKINIALYHGSVAGAMTDIGWVMDHGEMDIDILKKYDYALLGDIHKSNQILDKKGKIRYPGSLVQQNFGETMDKGFLFWDIKGKDKFTCVFHELTNPKPFYTIELTPKGKIPAKANPPIGSRIRVLATHNQTLMTVRRAVETAKHKFKPETITFLNKVTGRKSVEEEAKSAIHQDLRDRKVQENLMTEYLKDYDLEEEILEEVFTLNNKYNTIVEENEDTGRNISWKIKSFEWDNLFNYGENNKINFDNLQGTVGIFGKNYSGKSSVIDSILYTIYNSTSKNIRKNFNIINEHKDKAYGKVEIEIGGKIYTIHRTSEKYQKKFKGKLTDEAKTNVDFYCYDPATDETTNLNSTERNSTDKKIRKVFGEVDDFLLTSMSSQLGSLRFINEGTTKRKEILAKFLDLEFFDLKFKQAKKDSTEIKALLKKLSQKKHDKEIQEITHKLFVNEANTMKQRKQCDLIKQEREAILLEAKTLNDALEAVPTEPIDFNGSVKQKESSENNIERLLKENEKLTQEIKEKEDFLSKAGDFISSFDIEEVKEKKSIFTEQQLNLTKLASEMKSIEQKRKNLIRQTSILKGIPCGDEYLTTCKFVKDAYKISKEETTIQSALEQILERQEELKQEVIDLDIDSVNKNVENYQTLLNKNQLFERQTGQDKLQIEKNKNIIETNKKIVSSMKEKIEYYLENKEAIENYNKLLNEKKGLENKAKETDNSLQECEDTILELYKNHGYLEQRKENLESQKEELERLQNEYSAYDLFMRCMHSNGIAFDLIKQALPVINEEIAKVLSNIVDFKIYFETDDNRLNIYIQHPGHGPRPLENGSGAEKTLAAMAIRIAMISVSNMPKCNLMILDEPGSALDEEHLESFTRIMEMLKSYFDICILITHIESLKDAVDMTVDISKKDGFAFINQ